MIQKAGSGHIGTSFSSIDLFSWIMLNEINLQTLKSKPDCQNFEKFLNNRL